MHDFHKLPIWNIALGGQFVVKWKRWQDLKRFSQVPQHDSALEKRQQQFMLQNLSIWEQFAVL